MGPLEGPPRKRVSRRGASAQDSFLGPGWGPTRGGAGIQAPAATRARQDPSSPAWSSRRATLPAHGGGPGGGCSLSPNIGFTNITCCASGLSIGSSPLEWTRSGTSGSFRGLDLHASGDLDLHASGDLDLHASGDLIQVHSFFSNLQTKNRSDTCD